MKVVLVVGDGMADRPIKELGGLTPLQAAKIPSMDKIAKLGVCGIMDTISPGIPPGSDTSHLAIFGYNPVEVYEGRGVFEALGIGLDVKEGDLCFRSNFATIDEHMIVLDRRAGRIKEGGEEFAKALDGIKLESFPEIKIMFKNSTEHRGTLILRGPGLSRMVSNSDPHVENVAVQKVVPLEKSREAERTAKILNTLTEKSHEILESHPLNAKRKAKDLLPANIVLLRGASVLPRLKPITERYGINALCVAAGALYRGVCRAVGMDLIDVPGATGTVETDAIAKAKATVEGLLKYDLVFVHVKGADNASHDGNTKQKIRMIEKIDALLEYILKNTNKDELIIAVTADHTTPISVREHRGDPVPLAIMGPGVRADSVQRYSEIDCATGGLGRIRGLDLTPILMNYIGRVKKYGE
ncbi:MAG: 2,3-bisphosphoglycerate-independent phosphoglycerate mutase [Candidatus Bathyarchaeota archaeon]|nr:2,3-bisphosphoglycerate-independent phosphoglycerate mutase [Candidatus Bathyarchaeota archaeon]